MAYVAHIAIVDDWESAERLGEYEVSTRGVSLDDAGFIRAVDLSGIDRVLAEKYADIRYDLVLVILDTEPLSSEGLDVVESPRGRQQILGAIQTHGDAVIAVLPIGRVDERFVTPDLSRFGLPPAT